MTNTHLANLKKAILKLDPTGPAGFEGLLAAVLTEACGQPFRLASSGSQRGRDGDSAFDAGATYFEAKRYEGKIPKQEISAKLAEVIANDQGQVDTWILGATSPVSAQDAMHFRKLAGKFGIGFLLLDWTGDTAIPPLALIIVMSARVAKDFLTDHITDPAHAKLLSDALVAIDELRGISEFETQSEPLLREIRNPSVGLGLAKAANHRWLNEVFSSTNLARQQLGQPLAPHDASMDFLQPRSELSEGLRASFQETSSDRVFVVLGPEGVGKSWLVANTWLETNPSPILLMVPAGELRNPDDITHFEDFLIERLISQTRDSSTEIVRKRWRRRFAAWRANPDPENCRITLCVDGLNQNPRFPWPRWIEGASYSLKKLGGCLLVTTRSSHFLTIKHSISAPIQSIAVPEWTEAELKTILRSRDVDPNVLENEVFETLKNPRVLGIALELMNAQDIERIEQLSVGRLLFEHVRTSNLTGSSNLSPPEFVNALLKVANEYVSRWQIGTKDDLKLFVASDHGKLSEVSSGLLFCPVGDDPDLLRVADEVLLLALGIWLVYALEREFRNGRDPFANLESVIEPVAGLDDTGEILGSAVEVACLKDCVNIEVISALIRHYVSLQNLPETKREPFEALVKKHPQSFLKAAQDSALAEGRISSSGWLEDAIFQARGDDAVRSELESKIAEWLSYFSLAPEHMMDAVSEEDSAEKIQAERQKAVDKIEARLQNLTSTERDYMESHLARRDGKNVDQLHRLAIFLLAGLPLHKFASPLFSLAFSASLTPAYHALPGEYMQLVQFNRFDWAATREGLLNCIDRLGVELSRVGKWAIVRALHSTGDPSDAANAQQLASALTEQREKPQSWRLVESYCSSDPCDPSASCPDNIADTAEKYRNISVEETYLTLGRSQETLFFDMAMCGVARFEPEAAAIAIRKLAKQMLSREGLARRRATLALLPHSVLLPRQIVNELIRYAQASSEDRTGASGNSDERLTASHSLFIAFPHLSGDEQIQALNKMQSSHVLADTVGTLKSASSSVIESLLQESVADANVIRQVLLAMVISHTEVPLTLGLRKLVADMLLASDKRVRAEALRIASVSKDEFLLMRVSESNWDAGSLAVESNSWEIWCGSAALIAAAKAGMLDSVQAVDRMAFSHYGFAARQLGPDAASHIADLIDSALQKALAFSDVAGLPEIKQPVPDSPFSSPPFISLREQTDPSDQFERMRLLAETDEQFQERQRNLDSTYKGFRRELTNAEADLIVTDLGADGIAAIVEARSDIILRWHSLLLNASRAEKRRLQIFAMGFAGAIAKNNADLAVEIFRAYATLEPVVMHVAGVAEIPLESGVLWSLGSIPEITPLCFKRLENCGSDQEISIEVLAALKHNQAPVLQSYVQKLLASGEPANVARAVAIAGFSDKSKFATDVLAEFEDAAGFVGEACGAAREAYDRNTWARHWYEKLRAASTELDFWRYSVLLSEIVDGRFDLWRSNDETDDKFHVLYPTVARRLKQRIKKWHQKRKGTLFSTKVPNAVFLNRDFPSE